MEMKSIRGVGKFNPSVSEMLWRCSKAKPATRRLEISDHLSMQITFDGKFLEPCWSSRAKLSATTALTYRKKFLRCSNRGDRGCLESPEPWGGY